jgi:DNA replication and repair protein RecF
VFRSFRGAPDRELVKFGEDGFHVAVAVGSESVRRSAQTPKTPSGGQEGSVRQGAGRRVAVGFDARTGRKKVTIDGVETSRLADAIGVVRGAVLSPGDVVLVAGGPRERRHWLDVLLSLTARGYLVALATYRRALRQRTRATPAEMGAWERMLAETGATIVAARRELVERWRDAYREHVEAVGERGEPALAYVSRTEGTAGALLESLEKGRERDLARGRTGVGPHRDDLRLTLDGRELRNFGSAGQQRTAALALRLIEARALEESTGEPVTLCLDDAFAELDETRSARLGMVIEKVAADGRQVIAAVPKASDVPEVLASLPRLRMRDGRVSE